MNLALISNINFLSLSLSSGRKSISCLYSNTWQPDYYLCLSPRRLFPDSHCNHSKRKSYYNGRVCGHQEINEHHLAEETLGRLVEVEWYLSYITHLIEKKQENKLVGRGRKCNTETNLYKMYTNDAKLTWHKKKTDYPNQINTCSNLHQIFSFVLKWTSHHSQEK